MRFRALFGPRGAREGHKRIPRVRRNEKHRVSSKSGLWEGVSWPFFVFQVLFPNTKTFLFMCFFFPYERDSWGKTKIFFLKKMLLKISKCREILKNLENLKRSGKMLNIRNIHFFVLETLKFLERCRGDFCVFSALPGPRGGRKRILREK